MKNEYAYEEVYERRSNHEQRSMSALFATETECRNLDVTSSSNCFAIPTLYNHGKCYIKRVIWRSKERVPGKLGNKGNSHQITRPQESMLACRTQSRA